MGEVWLPSRRWEQTRLVNLPPPFEDDDENDCEAPGVPVSRNRQKIFVWQSYRITVFLEDHREYELNPNPFRKA